MLRKIYCISGLGADEKVFTNLSMQGYELSFIPWILPHKNERIDQYAIRMAEYINDDAPILLGVSFGGMMGIEIAKHRPVHKLIIVSSVKSVAELPRWMRLAGGLRLNKLLPVRPSNFTEKIDNVRLGVSNEAERAMVKAYRKSANPVYLNWAVHQVVNWKNAWQPENIIHIHGDSDKIFPIKKIRPTHVIEGGTHMMIYNRAGEISSCIEKVLGD